MDFDQELASVAEKYRREGYQVTIRPQESVLPPFTAGQSIDLLVTRGDEQVLVQVKRSREELRSDARLIGLAELVENHPGWRLDLVVLKAEDAADEVSEDAAEPPVGEIEQSLSQAEDMSRTGALSLSCVLSWAALEAAMRHAARAAGIAVKSAAPSFLLRALYTQGLLHRSDFDQLNQAIRVRNAVVHGLLVPAIDPALPPYVASVARKLLAENGQKPAA
jgi:uncharacterized protein YutE (UPF0331/DUF86 family)